MVSQNPHASFVTGAVLALGLITGCTNEVVNNTPNGVDNQPFSETTNGLSSEKPAASHSFDHAGVESLESVIGRYVTEGRLYGIHTRLVQGGTVVSDYTAGVRHLENQTPVDNETIYRIYSMSKPITGVAMMMLWEEGMFDLDDPISDYVPEFEDLKVLDGLSDDGTPILTELDRQPTMRELMSHTSGFGYGLSGSDPVNKAFRSKRVLRAPDLPTLIERTATIPLLSQPGEAWSYSVGMDVQGHIIEQLSGMSFGAFLQERLFDPLGMTDTGFFVPDEQYHRLSEVYGFHPESGEMVPVPYPSTQFRAKTVAFESGGGGLVSTMDDYGRFAQMLVNRGELDGVRILKAETIDLMTTNVLNKGQSMSSTGNSGSAAFSGIGMGLTFGVVADASSASTPAPQGTFFWGGAASTWFWVDPVNDLYFIIMVQVFDNNNPKGPLGLQEASTTAVYDALTSE